MSKQRLVIHIVLAILLVATLNALVLHISRRGKFSVDVATAPVSSTLTVDGKVVSGHIVYVPRGRHTIKASFRDFAPDQTTLFVDKASTLILMPIPVSDSALAYLQAHPETLQERERLSGSIFSSTGQILNQKYNFLDELPLLTSSFAIYKADPGRSKNTSSKPTIALDIVANNPIDRNRAIERVKSQLGIDPSTIEINFEGQPNVFNQLVSSTPGVNP